MIDEKVLIERLEEELKLADGEKEKCARENPLMFDNAKGYSTGISTAISIVKDLASEHNNGWIPCSERLPEEDGWYYTTKKCGEIVEAGMTKFVNGKWDHYYNTITTIAWKHRDTPYRKGE